MINNKIEGSKRTTWYGSLTCVCALQPPTKFNCGPLHSHTS